LMLMGQRFRRVPVMCAGVYIDFGQKTIFIPPPPSEITFIPSPVTRSIIIYFFNSYHCLFALIPYVAFLLPCYLRFSHFLSHFFLFLLHFPLFLFPFFIFFPQVTSADICIYIYIYMCNPCICVKLRYWYLPY
jgi:hypothetical protein